MVKTQRSAFTLAEILITLGIISIVASLTIPNLIQKTNDKEFVSAYLKNHNVLNNAYKETEAIKGFKLYGLEPDRFKEYFEEHLKLSGKSNCTHDVCLVDGSYFDYECDEGKCDYITVDVNGKKRPNQAGKDIYKFKITPNGLISEGEREICSGYDCGNYVLSHHKIFDGLLANCEEYGEDGRCSACSDGYKVNNGLCGAVNMAGCKAYSGESCSSCTDGYKNNDGTCEKLDLPKCLAYSGEKCTTCESGYYAKEAGYCEAQPIFCSEMLDDGESCTLENNTTAYNFNGTYISSEGLQYSPKQSNEYPNDYWKGASDVCESKNMRLPTYVELKNIYDNRNSLPASISGNAVYWTQDLYTGDAALGYATHNAYIINFSNYKDNEWTCKTCSSNHTAATNDISVLCIEK